MMKGVKNMRQNKKKILLRLSIFLFLILIMAVGYASFATQLRLSGSAEIIGAWDVRITNIEVVQASEGTNPGTPSFTNTSATFNAQLVKPKDEIIYRVTIQNLGSINAKLENVVFQTDEKTGSSAILYQTTSFANKLKAGEKTSFDIIVTYDENSKIPPTTKTKTITGIIEYVQE